MRASASEQPLIEVGTHVRRPSLRWTATGIVALAAIAGVVLGARNGVATVVTVPGSLLAGIGAAGVAILVLHLLSLVIEPATRRVQLVVQYCTGIAPALWVLLLLSSEGGLSPDATSGVMPSLLAVFGVLTGIVAVAANASDRSREANVARATLEEALATTSRLNLLLADAERERFAGYEDVIRNRVSRPLAATRAWAAQMPNDSLADWIDHFQATVMRPLAHLMHPVSVRVGLIPAIAALGRSFAVSASAELTDLDSRGELLDKNVRLQVFRWVRHLSANDDADQGAQTSVVISLSVREDHLHLAAHGVRWSRDLDPIQKVAGLTLLPVSADGELLLAAPLIGTAASVDLHQGVPRDPLTRVPRNNWLLLTRPPVMDVRLVLLVGIVTIPFSFAILRTADTPARLLTAVLSVFVPVVLSVPLTRVWVTPGTPRGTFTAIGLWSVLGLAAGLTNIAIVSVITPESVTGLTVPVRLAGGLLRYSLVGLLIVTARGLSAQATSDAIALRVRLAAANADRAGVLDMADETDRFLSETLHRTVQGRLAAISLLLRLSRREEALNELGTLCEVTLPSVEERLLTDAQSNVALSPILSSGALGIRVDDSIDWAAFEESAPSLAPIIRLVIEECAINAGRHGRGSTMVVAMSNNAGRLTLTCEDNGQGPAGEITRGLGSKLFDEICAEHQGEWSLARYGRKTRFSMSVASRSDVKRNVIP